MNVVPSGGIPDIESIATLFIGNGRSGFMVQSGTAAFRIEITSVEGDNAGFMELAVSAVTVQLAFQTVVEDDLAVILALALRHTEFINCFACLVGIG